MIFNIIGCLFSQLLKNNFNLGVSKEWNVNLNKLAGDDLANTSDNFFQWNLLNKSIIIINNSLKH